MILLDMAAAEVDEEGRIEKDVTAHQAVARSKPAGKRAPFFGIFNCYGFSLPDLKSKGAGNMPDKIAHKVLGCNSQAAGYFNYVELFK